MDADKPQQPPPPEPPPGTVRCPFCASCPCCRGTQWASPERVRQAESPEGVEP